MDEVRLGADGPILVHVEFSGPRTSRVIVMVLDTGAVLTVLPIETLRAIGYDPARARRRVELVTASGVEFAPVLAVRKAACLGRSVRNLEVACHDLPPQSPVKGLLGLNFLRRFDLRIDSIRGRLSLSDR